MKKTIIMLIVTTPYGSTFNNSPTIENIFSSIYLNNAWHDKESKSGTGSNLRQTSHIRKVLPLLLKELNIKTLIDAPCGDFHWLKEMNLNFLDKYIGVDIVPQLIQKNNRLHTHNQRKFIHANLLTDIMPTADLILCRDCLVHLKFKDIITTLKNFKQSGSKYLLTTTFTRKVSNRNIQKTGLWRPLNLQLAPFFLPNPLLLINEHCTESNRNGTYEDKCLGLWKLSDINI